MQGKQALLALVIAATPIGAAVSPEAQTESVDVAAADNAFGFRLLNAVQKTTPGENVVLSPVSAALDLSMVLNGAGGQTREQMLAALSEFTPEQWKLWQSRYVPQPGNIELPRFELEANYKLNEPLQALGMTRAFHPEGAQLTGLFTSARGQPGGQRFFISSVRQSTYWEVDEEGSEAAAVTTIGVKAAAVARPKQPFRMIVDRPFFCAIEDRRSGALPFVGAIYDPSARPGGR